MVYYIGTIPCDPNPLEHYGIKGQKWGVRRFQNADGTRTEAGKKRYSMTYLGQKEFSDSVHKARMDKKTGEAVRNKVSGSDKISKDIRDKIDTYTSANNRYNEMYKKYHSRLLKDMGIKEWDGDGGEEHTELMKRYPEYADSAKNDTKALKGYKDSPWK